jgi:hypothetical protein
MTGYISTHANSISWRAPYLPNLKHIVREGNTTMCNRTLADPYYASAGSSHRICERCRKAWLVEVNGTDK